MADLTMAVMGSVATHDLSARSLLKEASRLRRGDPMDVYRSRDLAVLTNGVYRFREPITSPRWVFIHIREVPNAIALRMKSRLTQAILADNGSALSLDPTVSHVVTIRRRRFRVLLGAMPVTMRNRLLTNKEITLTWDQARGHIRKKIVVDERDATRDDETTAVSDADLT